MRIAIIIVALLLVGGGGGGWWYYTNYMADSEDAVAEDAVTEEEKVYEYVELSPVHLPMIDAHGVQQMVSIVIVLEVDSKEVAERIKKQEPKLVNAYLTDMYGNMNNKYIVKDGVLQLENVRHRMSKLTKRVLGEDLVNDVLLQMVNQRKV